MRQPYLSVRTRRPSRWLADQTTEGHVVRRGMTGASTLHPSSLRGPRLALGAARPRLPGYPIAPASALVTTLIETDTLSVGIGNEVCVGLADPRTRKRPLKASAARGSVIGTRLEGHRDPVAHGLSNPFHGLVPAWGLH